MRDSYPAEHHDVDELFYSLDGEYLVEAATNMSFLPVSERRTAAYHLAGVRHGLEPTGKR